MDAKTRNKIVSLVDRLKDGGYAVHERSTLPNGTIIDRYFVGIEFKSNLKKKKTITGVPEPVKPKAIERALAYWNSLGIIIHQEATIEMDKAWKKATEKYTAVIIKQSMDRYSEILKSEYYFKHKWTLAEFLSRSNAISGMLDDGSVWVNYLKWKNSESGDVKAVIYANGK